MNPNAPETPDQNPVTPDQPSVDQPVADQPAVDQPNAFQPEPTSESAPESTPESTPEQPEAPQPFAPASPFTAPAATPGTTPTPPKKSNKKLFILIGAIVGALLVIGVIAAIIISTIAPSSEDYRDAARQYNDVSRAASSVSTKSYMVSSGLNTASASEFKSRVTDVKEAIETLKAENEELGKMKAVNFGEGASLYKTFNEKLAATIEYSEQTIASTEKLFPAMETCKEATSSTDADKRVDGLDDCSVALDNLGDLPEKNLDAYVKSIKSSYDELTSVVNSMSKLTNPFGSQYEEYKVLRDKMYDIQEDLRDAGSELSRASEKMTEDLNMKDAANALGDYLVDQQK